MADGFSHHFVVDAIGNLSPAETKIIMASPDDSKRERLHHYRLVTSDKPPSDDVTFWGLISGFRRTSPFVAPMLKPSHRRGHWMISFIVWVRLGCAKSLIETDLAGTRLTLEVCDEVAYVGHALWIH